MMLFVFSFSSYNTKMNFFSQTPSFIQSDDLLCQAKQELAARCVCESCIDAVECASLLFVYTNPSKKPDASGDEKQQIV